MTDSSPSDPKEESIRVQKSGIIAIVVALLLVALAVGAWWMNNSQSIEDLTPEEATEVMLEQMEELRSFSFAADMELDPLLSAGMFSEPSMSEALSTAMGIQNPNGLVLRMHGAVDGLNDEQQMSFTFEGGIKNDESESVVRADLISANLREQHVRVQLPEALQALAESKLDGFDLSFALDQWVSIKPQEIIEQLGLDAELEKAGLSTDTLFELPSKEQQERSRAIARENWFLPLTEKLEHEDIDGLDTIKFRADIDVEKLRQLYLETMQLQRDVYAERGAADELLTALDEAIAAFEKNGDFEEMFADIESEADLDVFAWLDASNGMPVQGQISVRSTEPPKMGGTFTMTLSEHNQPQDITAPEGAMTVQAFLGEFALRAAGTELEGFADDLTGSVAEPQEKAKENKKDQKKK